MKISKNQIIKLIKEQIKKVQNNDYYEHLLWLWNIHKSENIPYNIQGKISLNKDKDGIYIYVNKQEFDMVKNSIKKFLFDNKIKYKLIKKKSVYQPGLLSYSGDFYEFRIPDKEAIITFK